MANSRTFTIGGSKYTITENRVKVSMFKNQYIDDPDDPRLVPIVTQERRARAKMHWLAAAAFERLRIAASAEGFNLVAGNAWRKKAWRTYEEYERWLVAPVKKKIKNKVTGKVETVIKPRYPSVAIGKRRRGYVGAHTLGLAVDLGTPFKAEFGTSNGEQLRMLRLREFGWLVIHAAEYGWTPLINSERARGGISYPDHEPWHWEFKITYDQWASLPEGSEDLPLASLRRRLMSGSSRRDYQIAFEVGSTRQEDIEAAQLAQQAVVDGRFLVENTDQSGVLYNFQTGKWNDEV